MNRTIDERHQLLSKDANGCIVEAITGRLTFKKACDFARQNQSITQDRLDRGWSVWWGLVKMA